METGDGVLAFVLARVGEEERDARAAMGPSKQPGAVSKGVWVTRDFTVSDDDAMVTVAGSHDDASLDDGHAAHIARQDPRATLARCAALRALVADIQAECHDVNEQDCWYTCAVATEERDGGSTCREDPPGVCDCGRDSRVRRRLGHVAAIWAWHEDWRAEWDA